MEDSDTKEIFVQRCIAALGTGKVQVPNWKGLEISKVVNSEIKKRAEETYDKYHPVEEEEDDEDGEVEASEGEEPSEGEGDTEEEMDTGGQKASESTASKTKNKLNTAKNKRLLKEKIAARKKGNMAKRKAFPKRGKKNPGGNNNKSG